MEESRMISEALQKAIDSLQIHDVYVRDLVARCINDFDPKYDADLDALVVQTKHYVKQSMIVDVDENRLLRVFVDLGARWIDEAEKDESDSVKILIESAFVAEYVVQEELEEESIKEFSLKNASYHIWPYWRELLNNQCMRMHVPCIVLPTVQFADNRIDDSSQLEKSATKGG